MDFNWPQKYNINKDDIEVNSNIQDICGELINKPLTQVSLK